jgi:hypothetical protein
MERLDRALVDETKRQRSKDGNGKRDGRFVKPLGSPRFGRPIFQTISERGAGPQWKWVAETETGLAGWGGRTRTQKCRRKISL